MLGSHESKLALSVPNVGNGYHTVGVMRQFRNTRLIETMALMVESQQVGRKPCSFISLIPSYLLVLMPVGIGCAFCKPTVIRCNRYQPPLITSYCASALLSSSA